MLLVHKPLEVIAFNENGIGKQSFELTKQLTDRLTDVALLLETHLKPHERVFIQDYHVYRTNSFPNLKGGTAVTVRKGVAHAHVDLPPLVSAEATGICVPIGNSEVLLATVYKPPNKPWCDDVINLLIFINKSLVAGVLSVKDPAWNSHTSNPSGEKFLALFVSNDSHISASQSPTHYTPRGCGDIFDTVFHQNVHLPGVTVSDVLDSEHIPISFNILELLALRTLRPGLIHKQTGSVSNPDL
jgi:hypothetical protein